LLGRGDVTTGLPCNLPHVVLEVWQIILLVWIVVIPASVALLTALAARRRAARLRGSVYGATDQPGELLRLAVHARSLEHMSAAGAAHHGALGLGQREQLGDRAG
jgi:hypothetical protein